MVVFQKVIEAFLLPPGFFVTLFILMGILWRKKAPKKALLMFFLAIVFYFLSSIIGIFLLLYPLEKSHSYSDLQGAEVVVVLGGGVVKTPDGYQLSIHTAARLLKGLEIANKKHLPLIVTGGKLPGVDQLPEAEIMKQQAISLGFDEGNIFVEPLARTTKENAFYTTALMKQKAFKKAVLVTSAVHMKRAVYCFEKNGVSAIPCPTAFLYDHSKIEWIDLIPNRDALDANLAAIHEYFGLVWYRITDFLK